MLEKPNRIDEVAICLVFLQITAIIATVIDVQPARQVLGFLLLTLAPGLAIIRLFRFDTRNLLEIVLISVGLSLTFLMFLGLAVNALLPLLGINNPLSFETLFPAVNIAVLTLWVLGCLRRGESFKIPFSRIRKRYFLTLVLPLLGVIGGLLVNFSNNSTVLVFLMFIIAICFILTTLFLKDLSEARIFYPLLIFAIALALLFHEALITNYIRGFDINVEYYLFDLTESNSHWQSTVSLSREYASHNAMLSITILPTIYEKILAMSPTLVMKVLYPLIFALVPVGIYEFLRFRTGPKIAFVSAFFFMANSIFFNQMLWLTRQIIAEFFFVVLLILLLNKKPSPRTNLLIIIFVAALATSHYAISYLFLYVFVILWGFFVLTKKTSVHISVSLIVIVFVILFSWYSYVSASGPLAVASEFAGNIFSNLGGFFNPETRGEEVLMGLGLQSPPSIWHIVGRGLMYLAELFIFVGWLASLTVRQKIVSFDKEYLVASTLNMALLVMGILLPMFAEGFKMSRFFHISLFFLAPFFYLGAKYCMQLVGNVWEGKMGSRIIRKLTRRSLKLSDFFVATFLGSLLLFQTEVIYELAGVESYSLPFSRYRMGLVPYTQGYISTSRMFLVQDG